MSIHDAEDWALAERERIELKAELEAAKIALMEKEAEIKRLKESVLIFPTDFMTAKLQLDEDCSRKVTILYDPTFLASVTIVAKQYK